MNAVSKHFIAVAIGIASSGISVTASAAALQGFTAGCFSGCAFSFPSTSVAFSSPIDLDYTVLTDGRTHTWTFRFTSADPNARLFLDFPSQVDALFEVRTRTGSMPARNQSPVYTFSQQVLPGFTQIISSAPQSFDYCNLANRPIGELCSRNQRIWGNGTYLFVNSTAPVSGVFTESVSAPVSPPAVPEPSTWAMLILGFGGIGAMMRRRAPRSPALDLVSQ